MDTPHTLRQQLYRIIFFTDTPAGQRFDRYLLLAILASLVVVMLDSIDTIRSQYLIDLLAILPGILALFYGDAQYLMIIRVIRMLRVFRVLKLSPYLRQANFLLTALRGSKQKIIVFFACIASLVTMYVIEGPAHGFTSIPKGIYWAVVTLTTVGFGDIVPKTPLGQALSTLVMITGYSIIAVPTGIFTAELASAMRDGDQLRHDCPSCAKNLHEQGASFCSRCGNPLYTRTTEQS